MPLIASNGIELYAERFGHGPELVLIHGLGGDIRMWEPLQPFLQNAFSIIAFDLRGSGRSDKPNIPFTVPMLANDTAGLIGAMSTNPVHVLGFSLGGCIALQLALRRPDLVRRLSLVSTLPSWQTPFPPSPVVKEILSRTEVTPGTLRDVYRIAFGPEYQKNLSADEFIELRIRDEMPQPMQSYLHQLHALQTFDLIESVSQIRTRTHILAGDEDHIVPTENAHWFANHVRDSRLTILGGVGHMLPLEAPKELAERLISMEEES
jgi:pimeloyl-ACP methyl ester carboxylesterase